MNRFQRGVTAVWVVVVGCSESPPQHSDAAGRVPSEPFVDIQSSDDSSAAMSLAGKVVGVGEASGVYVSLPLGGTVRSILVAPGDRVTRGQVIAEVLAADLAASAASVEGATREIAVHEERRVQLEGLVRDGFARADQLHESEHLIAEGATRRAASTALLRGAGLLAGDIAHLGQTGWYRVRAPVEGVLLSVTADIGQTLPIGGTFGRIACEGKLRLEVISAAALLGEAHIVREEARIPLSRVGDSIRDPETGMFVTFYEIPEAFPTSDGERLRVSVSEVASDAEWRVPRAAVALGDSPSSGFVLRERGNTKIEVAIRAIDHDHAFVHANANELVGSDRVSVRPDVVLSLRTSAVGEL